MKSQGRISLPAFQLTRRNHLPTLWRFLVGLSRGVKSKDLMQNRCHGVYQALLNTVPALFQHVQPKSQKDPKSIKKRLCQQHDCLVKLLTCIQHHQSVLLGIGSHCLGVPVGPLQGVQYHLSRFREGQIQTNIAYEIEPNTLRGLWSMQSYKFRLKFPCFTSRRLTQANQQICFRCVCVCGGTWTWTRPHLYSSSHHCQGSGMLQHIHEPELLCWAVAHLKLATCFNRLSSPSHS